MDLNRAVTPKSCLLVLACALAAGFAFVLLTGPVERPPDRAKPSPDLAGRESMAFLQGCEFVKRHLRAPGAADFPWLDFEARHQGGGVYFVRSWVDAQNAFGGEVREVWKATVRYKGGEPGDIRNWELLSLIIGDRRVAP